MTIEKKPFVAYKEEHERIKDRLENDVITVRLNPTEREMIENMKKHCLSTSDSGVLKGFAKIGLNVIQSQVCPYSMNTLFKKKVT